MMVQTWELGKGHDPRRAGKFESPFRAKRRKGQCRLAGKVECNYIFVITNLRFEWDEAKNAANRRKHGISFEEAAHVFRDPFHLSVQDRHEGGEERWQTIGMIGQLLAVLVAHTYRLAGEDGLTIECIRVISARRATKAQRRRYENEHA
jgi:uncharacterized DUF497 family protein